MNTISEVMHVTTIPSDSKTWVIIIQIQACDKIKRKNNIKCLSIGELY